MGSFDKLKYKTYDTSNGFGNAQQWKEKFTERMGNELVVDILKFPELHRSKTKKELTKAYHKLSLIHHPDKETGNEETFKEMQKVYDSLKQKMK